MDIGMTTIYPWESNKVWLEIPKKDYYDTLQKVQWSKHCNSHNNQDKGTVH